MDDTRVHAAANCLGQTCLSWQSDGELSPGDRQLVLARLLEVDACAAGSRECWMISEGRPTPRNPRPPRAKLLSLQSVAPPWLPNSALACLPPAH